MGRGVGLGVGRGLGRGVGFGVVSIVAGVGRGRGRKGLGLMRGCLEGVVGAAVVGTGVVGAGVVTAGVVGAGVVTAGVVGMAVNRENKEGLTEVKAGLTEVSGEKVVSRTSSSGSASSGSSTAGLVKMTGLVSGISGNSVAGNVLGASSSGRVGRRAISTRGRRGRSRVSGRWVSGSMGATVVVVVVARARKKF